MLGPRKQRRLTLLVHLSVSQNFLRSIIRLKIPVGIHSSGHTIFWKRFLSIAIGNHLRWWSYQKCPFSEKHNQNYGNNCSSRSLWCARFPKYKIVQSLSRHARFESLKDMTGSEMKLHTSNDTGAAIAFCQIEVWHAIFADYSFSEVKSAFSTVFCLLLKLLCLG